MAAPNPGKSWCVLLTCRFLSQHTERGVFLPKISSLILVMRDVFFHYYKGKTKECISALILWKHKV